MCRNLI
nr:unnamed protein product [Callosobruchus analis]CAI5855681.1 unnamed protein product [Callosobruchus analis]